MPRKTRAIRLDEVSNAADYLEKALYFLSTEDNDNLAWKWVAISLQGALYGFAICGSDGTSFLNVVKRKKGESLDDLRKSLGVRTEPFKLISIHHALKLCKERDVLHLTPEQEKALCFLTDEIRNPFEHYIPGLWSILKRGIPAIFRHVFEVILQLIENKEFQHRWHSETKRRKAISNCKKGIRLLKKLEEEYG